jgi:hypothetical protein
MQKPPPRPDKPKSPTKVWWIVGAVIVGLFVLSSITRSSGTGGPLHPGGSSRHTVTYKVTGGHGASVTYQNESQDTGQDTEAGTPWSDVESMSDGDFYYVSAQNQGGGTITCSVVVDGVTVDSNSASGEYAICSASGTI